MLNSLGKDELTWLPAWAFQSPLAWPSQATSPLELVCDSSQTTSGDCGSQAHS